MTSKQRANWDVRQKAMQLWLTFCRLPDFFQGSRHSVFSFMENRLKAEKIQEKCLLAGEPEVSQQQEQQQQQQPWQQKDKLFFK